MTLVVANERARWEYWTEQLADTGPSARCRDPRHRRMMTAIPVLLEEFRALEADLEIAREAAAREQQRRHTLLDQIPLACILTDETGAVREANRDAALLLNASAQRLSGQPLQLFMVDRDGFAALLREAVDRDARLDREVLIRPLEHGAVRCRTIVRRAEGVEPRLWRWFFLPEASLAGV